MTSEGRLTRLEKIVEKLVQVALSSDERMNNSDAKVAALTDAQTQTQGALKTLILKTADLAESRARLEESHIRLTEAHARLTESHVHLAESHARVEESHARLEESLARLADSQAHTDARLGALIDIVRGQREGKAPEYSEEGDADE